MTIFGKSIKHNRRLKQKATTDSTRRASVLETGTDLLVSGFRLKSNGIVFEIVFEKSLETYHYYYCLLKKIHAYLKFIDQQ